MDKKLSDMDFRIGLLFSGNYERVLIMSEIARMLGVNHRTVSLHLKNLERLAVLKVEKRSGKIVVAKPYLNQNFFSFMVMCEVYKFLTDRRIEITKMAERCIKNRFCIVFGSFADYTERERSDIDIITDRRFPAADFPHRAQFFVYRKIKNIPEHLFKQALKKHLIIKGQELFVKEVVRRYGYNQ